MKNIVIFILVLFSTNIFSQSTDSVKYDKTNTLDSLSILYNMKVYARVNYYYKDTVITEIQVIRPCKEYPQGLWYFVDGKKVIIPNKKQ